MKRIAFICHGNICRSPAAEFIMRGILLERGMGKEFEVDSLATSFEEIGNDVYPPMKAALSKAKITCYPHRARRFERADYDRFDLVFYMDDHNRRVLEFTHPDTAHKYHPVTMFRSDIAEIEDPWYSHRYDLVVTQLRECLAAIAEHLYEL